MFPGTDLSVISQTNLNLLRDLCKINKVNGCGCIDSGGDMKGEVGECIEHIRQLMVLTEELVPKSEDVKSETIGDMVDSEMQLTSKAIEQAAKKIQV